MEYKIYTLSLNHLHQSVFMPFYYHRCAVVPRNKTVIILNAQVEFVSFSIKKRNHSSTKSPAGQKMPNNVDVYTTKVLKCGKNSIR